MVRGAAAHRLVSALRPGRGLQALRWAVPSGVSRALPEKLLLERGVSALSEAACFSWRSRHRTRVEEPPGVVDSTGPMESKGALLTVAIPLIAFKVWFAILLLTYAPTRDGVVWIAATHWPLMTSTTRRRAS